MKARLGLLAGVGVGIATIATGSSLAEAPVPQCFGEDVTVLGTAGNDDIELSDETEPQVVHGLEGDDSITGGQAQDALCGGAGIDAVYGEAGKDGINTGSGRDYGNGEGGADLVKGGADNDRGEVTWRVGTPEEGGFGARLDGGGGNDTIRGGGGNDTILGEGGNDSIRGQSGIDACNGGLGDDDVDCERPYLPE